LRKGNVLVATARPELVGDGQGTAETATRTTGHRVRERERSEGERVV
jgi:hypothetical protein